MKYFIVQILLLAACACRAQNTHINNHPDGKSSLPVYFLDSVKVSFDDNRFKYIASTEFASIKVGQRTAQYPDGSIYFTLKDHNRLAELMSDKLLSLKQIAYAHINPAERNKKILYLINDMLLTDTTKVSIPSRYVKKVAVVNSRDMPYFKTAMPNVVLLKITTKDPVLYIKGNNFNGYAIPGMAN